MGMNSQLPLVDADVNLGNVASSSFDREGSTQRLALALRDRRPCRDCGSDDGRVWWLVPDDFWLCVPCDDLLHEAMRVYAASSKL